MNRSHLWDIATIIVTGLLAFGSQIVWLGFFQDDWNFVYYSASRGTQGLFEFLIVDGRPGATWVYAAGFSIFEYIPALWQAFSISLRILTTITFYLILNGLWPARRRSNLIASIIFLVYPFFTIQPLSVAYAPHFTSYFLYGLSIFLMMQAAEKPEKYIWYSAPAILLTFLHLFTTEYFASLELLRPAILWALLHPRKETTTRAKLRQTLIYWAPYLLALIFFGYWRSSFSASLGVRNDPLSTITNLQDTFSPIARNAVADLVLMLIDSWSNLIRPELFVIGPIRNFFILASMLIGGLCFYFLTRKIGQAEGLIEKKDWTFLMAGAIIYTAGIIVPYAAGFIVHLKLAPWNGRFALPVLAGLALVVTGVIELLITRRNTRTIFYACVIGLLIGFHNQNTFNFKTAWEKQERFYQQLIWRAPSIDPGTAIIADEEILGYMGDYPTSLAINSIYETEPSFNVPYWFFAISENFDFDVDNATEQDHLVNTRGALVFRGENEDSTYITYLPEMGQCLRILRPEDSEHRHLSPNMKKAARLSNIEGIREQENTSRVFRQITNENMDTWCYFYQKASLALQMEEWDVIISLWNEAQNKYLRPYDGFELIPFIEAYAHSGQWENALQITDRANRITPAMYFILCPTWERLANETLPNDGRDAAVSEASEILKCATP